MHNAAHQLSNDPVLSFQSAMADAGLSCPDIPIADGSIHRFKVEGDKNGSNNGWYVLHPDGVPAGSFGSWKTGETINWSAKSEKTLSDDERETLKKHREQAKKAREDERIKVHQEAKQIANDLWNKGQPEHGHHKYIRNKQVKAYGIRNKGYDLLIPLRDTNGEIHSLQTIDIDGKKLFTPGGAI